MSIGRTESRNRIGLRPPTNASMETRQSESMSNLRSRSQSVEDETISGQCLIDGLTLVCLLTSESNPSGATL
jgi:hypothetical protein